MIYKHAWVNIPVYKFGSHGHELRHVSSNQNNKQAQRSYFRVKTDKHSLSKRLSSWYKQINQSYTCMPNRATQ